MRRQYILVGIVIFLLILFVSVWLYSSQKKSKQNDTNNSSNGEPRVVAIGLSEQNGSGQSGTAVLTEKGDKVVVEIMLTGGPSDLEQPAHIHDGNCPEVGGVRYPLNFPKGGQSITELNVSWDTLATQLPLALNIHKSQTEAKDYTSCGNLIF